MVDYHVLVVPFPGQSSINPCLQFSKRLINIGIKVTFLTSLSATSRMPKTLFSMIDGINLVSFSDGYENGWPGADNAADFLSSLRKHSSKAVADLIASKRKTGQSFTHVIYTILLPWVGRVSQNLGVPSTLLWIQPATLFYIYFYFFNNNVDIVGRNEVIQLPGLPVFEPNDLPSFLLDSSPSVYTFILPMFREHFEVLDREKTRPKVLVNTFDALELETLRNINKYELMSIGPLIPSAFLDGKNPSDTSFGGDLIQKSIDDIEWLDSQEKESIIYVAFGSFSSLSKPQMEEIAKGLIKNQRPFFWVIRGSENREKLAEMISCKEELEKQGKIVPWCTQVEVLSHTCVRCFVTHCGWNSSIESLVSGIPVVAFPLWTDQATNAKLIQDYWRTGIRVKANDEGLVEADELKRCLEVVMSGERAEEMRIQAKKWKEFAKEAMNENGTSNLNLNVFRDHITRSS